MFPSAKMYQINNICFHFKKKNKVVPKKINEKLYFSKTKRENEMACIASMRHVREVIIAQSTDI